MRRTVIGGSKKKNIIGRATLMSLGVVLVIIFFSLQGGNTKGAPALTKSSYPTNILKPSETSAPIITPSETLIVLPFGEPNAMPSETDGSEKIIGDSLKELSVGPWRDNHVECDKDPKHYSVKIYGVKILGGNPPYKIAFRQFDELINNKIALNNGDNIFREPVVVNKGAYVNVVISFNLISGDEISWEGELYYHYLGGPKCP